MIRRFALLCLLAASACSVAPPMMAPVVAPAPAAPIINPQSSKERFITAVAASGCTFNQSNANAILASATLSREDVARILTELRTEGRGQIAGDGTSFRLTTGACA